MPAGDIGALLARFSEMKQKTFARNREIVPDHRHMWNGPPGKCFFISNGSLSGNGAVICPAF